jgi:hypothetical protein
MLTIKTYPKWFVTLAFGGFLSGVMLYGCRSEQTSSQGVGAASPATQPATFALFGPSPQKTGVELWSENCARCHNMRPPEEFSGQQWEIIVHHMRLRANLTGEEAREITKILQASD